MTIFTNIKNQTFAALTAIAIGLATPIVATAEMLTSSQIVVYDDVVRLGDIFDVNGIFAAEELFQAPPLGRTGVLSATNLSKLAQKYSLDWQNVENFAKVTITRQAKTIDQASIIDIITEYAIHNQHIAGDNGQTRIKLANKFKSITIAASDFANFEITDFAYRPFNDQFNIEFRYIQAGAYRSQNLSGKIENLVQVPVFSNNIRRDQTIRLTDIKFIQLNNRRVAENIILNVEDIVGKSAKNNIRASQPIGSHQLKFADLVKKNTIINLSFKLGRIHLAIKARALTTGAKGALIRVMNLKSGKQIDAIVTGIDQAMTINSIQQNKTTAKIALNN